MRWFVIFLAAGECLAQQTLPQFLALTPAQVSNINQLESAFGAYVSAEESRVAVINAELMTLYASPPPDPGELGPRYVELEAIRRDAAAHVTALEQQVNALLSPAQMASIQSLNAAATLQPLVSDAQCAFLVDAPVAPGFASAFFVPTALERTGSFGSPPYIPSAPGPTFCYSSTFPISVREYLGLSDAQVAAIAAVSTAYNEYDQRQQNSIADLQVQIRDETAKAAPDPFTLGTEYAQLTAIAQDVQAQAAQLNQLARATLTPQQTGLLSVLQVAVTLQPLITAAQNCKFLSASGSDQNIYYYASSCFLR